MQVSKYIAITIIICATQVYAEMKAPYLYVSFDQKFNMDGAGAEKLKRFPKLLFPGVAKAPAGKFVEGISGKAFIPSETLTIQGKGIFPAPEGTISLWIKPVNYEKDWIGGPRLTPGRIGAFLTGVMKDESGEARCSLQVRLYQHDYCSALFWVEYWGWPAQQFRPTGPNPSFKIWQKNKWRMLTVVWFKGERRIYFNGIRIQHGMTGSGKKDYIAASDNYERDGTSTTEVSRSPTKPGEYLSIPAGSKVVDELMVWDIPLTDAQVATLFFSKMPQSGMKGTVQDVPQLTEAK